MLYKDYLKSLNSVFEFRVINKARKLYNEQLFEAYKNNITIKKSDWISCFGLAKNDSKEILINTKLIPHLDDQLICLRHELHHILYDKNVRIDNRDRYIYDLKMNEVNAYIADCSLAVKLKPKNYDIKAQTKIYEKYGKQGIIDMVFSDRTFVINIKPGILDLYSPSFSETYNQKFGDTWDSLYSLTNASKV